jgi:hypothetical protein
VVFIKQLEEAATSVNFRFFENLLGRFENLLLIAGVSSALCLLFREFLFYRGLGVSGDFTIGEVIPI